MTKGMSSTRVTCCPLCFAPFPTSIIAAHASNCMGEKRSCRKGKEPSAVSASPGASGSVSVSASVSSSSSSSVLKSVSGSMSKSKPYPMVSATPKSDSEQEQDDPRPASESPPPSPAKSRAKKNLAGASARKKLNKISPAEAKKKRPRRSSSRSSSESSSSSSSSSSSPASSRGSSPQRPVARPPPKGAAKRKKRRNEPPPPPQSNSNLPLAEEMRPKALRELQGQESILASDVFLHSVLEKKNGNIPNLILWGPPGCGKTSIAHIILQKCKDGDIKAKFVKMSACVSAINDVREAVAKAKNEWSMLKRKTIIFMDEIHRFNKVQQDAFLPHIENGTIVLIGATTENPSFSLNNALLSRCRVLPLQKLSPTDLEIIMKRSLDKRGFILGVHIDKEAITYLSNVCDGDARTALNSLQIAMDVHCSSDHGRGNLKVEDIKECLQRSHILYDRRGDEHFHCASALQKSIRGSDENAALYWVMRMLVGGEDPMFIARRLIVIASEDVGLGDPQALGVAVSAMHGCQLVGLPECQVVLAQAVVYLSRAPKSREVQSAMTSVLNNIKNTPGNMPGVPLHLRNAGSSLLRGYAKDTKSEKSFMPEGLEDMNFFDDDVNSFNNMKSTGLKKSK